MRWPLPYRATMAGMTHVLVLAKEPVPGRVKTRLCPPCTPTEAAVIAAAALSDTLAAVAASGADRKVLALEGRPGPWLPAGFEVVPQVQGGLDQRLAAAWAHAGGPGVQIGMDTPQVTGPDLDRALATLLEPQVDAVLGPATDGGWWLLGLRRADPRVFLGVPTSRADTGRLQLERLVELDLVTRLVAERADLDTMADAVALAAAWPDSATAAAVATVLPGTREAAR